MMTRVIAGMAEREGAEPAAIRARYERANPLGRLAAVGDVANACVFLASPLASYINGAALAVDGGEPPG
jgi:3-oxoacyl-[acyl-carrier protein] reductase